MDKLFTAASMLASYLKEVGYGEHCGMPQKGNCKGGNAGVLIMCEGIPDADATDY